MVSTVVIEYPEATCAAHDLRARGLLRGWTSWAPLGRRPETRLYWERELPPGPCVVVNGSGNYHQETYGVVAALRRRGPLAYVHVDAHPDKDAGFRWRLDCASFVGAVLELPEVLEGVVLGTYLRRGLHDLPWIVFGPAVNYYRFDYFAKLRQYPVRRTLLREAHFRYTRGDGDSARRNLAISQARAERLPANRKQHRRGLLVRWRGLEAFDPRSIAGDAVYISVDLDVLRRGIVTDWRRKGKQADDNDGELSLDALLALLHRVGRARRVVGADLCGLTEAWAKLPPERLRESLDTIAAVYRTLVELIEG